MICKKNFMDTIHNIQTNLFTHIASFGEKTPWADPVFVALSYWFFYLVLGAVIVRLLYKIVQAKSIQEKKQSFKEAFVLLFSLVLTWMIVTLIKVLTAVPRPFEVIDNVRLLSPYIGGGDSFPSGHTAIAAALAGAIRPYHHRAGTLLILFALLVGISRVYLGLHFPIDVFVGFLVGLLIADIVRRLADML